MIISKNKFHHIILATNYLLHDIKLRFIKTTKKCNIWNYIVTKICFDFEYKECLLSILKIKLDLWPKYFVFSFIKIKVKILMLLGKWIYYVVLPKTYYFLWVFHFLKPYSPTYPAQPTLLGFFGWVWSGFSGYPTCVHPYI